MCDVCREIWTRLDSLRDESIPKAAATPEPGTCATGHVLAAIGTWFVANALTHWDPNQLLNMVGSAMKDQGVALQVFGQAIDLRAGDEETKH